MRAYRYVVDHGEVFRMTETRYRRYLLAEACAELNLAWPIPDGTDDLEPYWRAEESAMADHTLTESGWIPSWEWGIALEDPTTDELHAYIEGRS